MKGKYKVEIKSPYDRVREWREKNIEKVKAHRKVFVALRNKTLQKEKCLFCLNNIVEAHHNDYSKPLEVIWLCKEHHVEEDKKRRITN